MSKKLPGAGKPQILPAGEYDYTTPPVPLTLDGFVNGHVKDRDDQFWWRSDQKQRPGDYRECFEMLELPAAEEFEQWDEDKQNALRLREFLRRRNGVWFLNDGQPTYLTGLHYYYLTCYHIDTGLPKYRDADLEVFYVFDLAAKDDHCYGTLLITRRRYGKSYLGGVRQLGTITSTKNAHGGIQSKTDPDAKKLFKRAIVAPWRKLPPWAKPLDDEASSNPDNALRFFAPTKKGAKAKLAKYTVALDSWIDFDNSLNGAYDGEKLLDFLSDEIFKKQKNDPEQRWSIVRKMQKEEGIAVGKSLHTSSVEEIEDEGAARARSMWNDSDPKTKDEFGETKSWLNRLFIAAHRAYKVDKFGRDLPIGRRTLEAQRAAVQHDPVKYMAECRANPFTIEECLRGAGRTSLLNLTAVHTAQDAIAQLAKPVVHRFDLTWEDWNDRRVVKTVDNKVNGRFQIVSAALPGPERLNQAHDAGTVSTPLGFVTKWVPTQDVFFAIGTDPFDKKTALLAGGKKSGSNAAAYAYRKLDSVVEMERAEYDENNPIAHWPTNGFMVQYINRPDLPSIYYEDMVMLSHLLGCSILYENQKDKILDHFINRGYEAFCINRPRTNGKAVSKKEKQTPGIAATEEVIGEYYERLMEFTFGPLAEDWRRCPFPELLQDWIDFEIDNTKDYDPTVASGYTLMQARRFTRPPAKPIDASLTTQSNYFNV